MIVTPNLQNKIIKLHLKQHFDTSQVDILKFYIQSESKSKLLGEEDKFKLNLTNQSNRKGTIVKK